jgi:poly(3-hydroxybutyrate) depolymerase
MRRDDLRTLVPRLAGAAALAALLGVSCLRPSPPPAGGQAAPPKPDGASGLGVERALDDARTAALASLAKARGAPLADLSRAISLPSVERLVDDGDAVRAHVTNADRDLAFVRRSYETARAYADVLGGGEDPYDTARGVVIKAYRSEWDGSLQPYALYVPQGYDPKHAWPLVVALHGAQSNHRQMLRRVFGLDNQPGESDEEASRDELPFPDVPAFVVAPYGRGEIMGFDGLGEEDVLRVMADVRRAYKIDAARVSLTGLSMGGGGTWTIGLRHPELFAALAPVCGVTDVRKWIAPGDAGDYDGKALDEASPLAFAENAAGLRVLIFHGDADPVVPVTDSRRMVARFKQLGWLGKSVTYTEYPGVDHRAWVPAYRDAALLRTLAGLERDPKAPRAARKPFPADRAVASLFGKSPPRERPHLYVYGTHGAPEAVAAARALAARLADWGPGVAARFVVKADADVTSDDGARFDLVLVGAGPLNALAARVAVPPELGQPGLAGDHAARWFAPSPLGHGRRAEVFGALTPAGLAKLGRFAVPNRDSWAPEANRPVIILD